MDDAPGCRNSTGHRLCLQHVTCDLLPAPREREREGKPIKRLGDIKFGGNAGFLSLPIQVNCESNDERIREVGTLDIRDIKELASLRCGHALWLGFYFFFPNNFLEINTDKS